MIKFFAGLFSLSSIIASPIFAAGIVRDLHPDQYIDLDVEVTSFTHDPSEEIRAFAAVVNPYTNPIACRMKLSIPTVTGGGTSFYNVEMSDIIIFPRGLAKETEAVRIDTTHLGPREKLANNLRLEQKSGALCRGWRMGQRLPRQTCWHFAPLFEQGCEAARVAGMNYLSLIRDHLHLGDCSCNTGL